MQKPYYLFIFLYVISISITHAQTLYGFVNEQSSKEHLAGANVYCQDNKKGAITNKYGFYSLVLPTTGDSVTLVVSMLGYKTLTKTIRIKSTVLDIELMPLVQELDEVIVKTEETKISQTLRMSVQRISVKQIQELPALLGEKDLMKTLQLLPGIQRGNDGNGIIFVRGGASDQNLLLLDEAPVYNLFHAGGFFSVFNANAIKGFEVTKGAFPARYGGRLSAVIDVQTRNGNKKNTTGEVGIGLLSSTLLVEGPIQKNKSSFLFSGRMSYLDKLYSVFRPLKSDKFLFGLYDYIAKLHFELGPKDKLYISNYFGRDSFTWQYANKFVNNSTTNYYKQFDFNLNWGNNTGTVRWNHIFSPKLFANTSATFSQYNFKYKNESIVGQTGSYAETIDQANFEAKIQDFGLKTDFDYYFSDKHHLRFGLGTVRHRFVPERIKLHNSDNNFVKDTASIVNASEYYGYVEDEYHPTQNLLVNLGLRYSGFAVGTNYGYFEPRLGIAYLLPNQWTLKGGYATMHQFVHLASNSGVGFPFDVWIPTTAVIKPQSSRQISLGIAKDITKKGLELSAEIYYKQMDNLIALREGASFLSGNTLDIFKASLSYKQDTWENKIVQGTGRAYGLEFLLQKKYGKLTGWVSYTLSKVTNRFEELNNGLEYFPRYDRRHSLSLVGIYHLKLNITLSGTWSYASGQRLTVPVGKIGVASPAAGLRSSDFVNKSVYEYGNYGNFKTPDYHRLDLNIQFTKPRPKNRTRIWELGIYNVYNRLNPFFYTFSESTPVQFIKVSIFPVLGSVSYHLKF